MSSLPLITAVCKGYVVRVPLQFYTHFCICNYQLNAFTFSIIDGNLLLVRMRSALLIE